MTYRERRARRAERLNEWADGREKKADAAYEKAHEIADGIPFGQPILVGHHSQGRAERDRERIDSGMRSSVENSAKATEMRDRAATIEAQDARAVYDDDPDAVERLTEQVDALEAERDAIKAYNASCRKGAPDESLLPEKHRASLEATRRYAPYQLGKNGQIGFTNLSATINRKKKRRDALARRRANPQAERGRPMLARFASDCGECGERIEKGDAILYFRAERRAVHARHEEGGDT